MKKRRLPSAYDLSDLEHSANRFTAPHMRSSLWFENEKMGLPSAPDMALGKHGVCRVSDLIHSATRFTVPTHVY